MSGSRVLSPEETKPRASWNPLTRLKTLLRASRIMDEVSSAMHSEDELAAASVLDSFGSVDLQAKRSVMLRAQRILPVYSSFTFESHSKARAVSVLAAIFREGAKALPVNEDGSVAAGEFSRAIRVLKAVGGDTTFFDPKDPVHRKTRLACAEALWQLDAGGNEFWESRLRDQVTLQFTIDSILSLGEETKAGGTGWDLLRSNLNRIFEDVARSASPSKREFITCMLLDRDPSIIKSALAGAVFFDPLPEEFLHISGEISRMGEDLATHSLYFQEGIKHRDMLAYADGRQFEGAWGLIRLYHGGAGHLRPLLIKAGIEMAEVIVEPGGSEEEALSKRQEAARILAALHSSGITIPGVDVNIRRG